MKLASKILLIPVLFLIVISNSFSKVIPAGPAIKFDDMSYDFGVVKQGIELEHIFKFTNTGDGTLEITSVKPSCGCTGVVMDEKKEFTQGEEGEIKITFNTQGRQGINSKAVTVNTNDPENPIIILTFKCEVEDKN